MTRPALDALCADCHHPFGAHYTSYDGTATGCAYTATDPRNIDCYDCTGFMQIYRDEVITSSGEYTIARRRLDAEVYGQR